MNPNFILRQMKEKRKAAKRSLHLVFVDLKKVYDLAQAVLEKCRLCMKITQSFLLIMLMDELLTDVRKQTHQCMLFADNMGESHAGLTTQLGVLQLALESIGLQIARLKTENMTFQ